MRALLLALLIFINLSALNAENTKFRPGLHYGLWTIVEADIQYKWLYGFAAIGSDVSLAPWIVMSYLSGDQGAYQGQTAIEQRWNLNGVGSGFIVGAGPTLSLDDEILIDFLVVDMLSFFSKGGYTHSPGFALGLRFVIDDGLELGLKIPIFGYGYGRMFNQGGDTELAPIPDGDRIIRFFSNSLVSMPFFSIGWRF